MSERGPILDMLGAERPLLQRRASLAEEAADMLRNLILLERLEPGAPIPERELAEALGISRTPLREAMRTLEREGLIEYSKTRRPSVANPTLEALSHDLSVLGALEALAGEEACARVTDDEIATVRRLNQQMFETSDSSEPLEFFKADMAFHRTIVIASRNPPLIETHRQFNARLWRARFISSRRRPNRARTLAQHEDIAAAFTTRDAAACAEALRDHLRTAVENIAAAMATQGAPATEAQGETR